VGIHSSSCLNLAEDEGNSLDALEDRKNGCPPQKSCKEYGKNLPITYKVR
jgi:hypothetical protein